MRHTTFTMLGNFHQLKDLAISGYSVFRKSLVSLWSLRLIARPRGANAICETVFDRDRWQGEPIALPPAGRGMRSILLKDTATALECPMNAWNPAYKDLCNFADELGCSSFTKLRDGFVKQATQRFGNDS